MKKIIIALACMALAITNMQAQEFTLEYNIGYGLYSMSDLKGALKDAAGSGLKGVKTTDNFPGNFTHNFRVGIQQEQHQIGLTYSHQNTSGQNHLADPTGEYKLKIKNTGNQLGIFYRFHCLEGKISPYFELASGIVFNNCKMEEYIRVDAEVQQEKSTLVGVNFFLQPAIGLRYKITTFAAIIASVGYEWDPTGKLHLKGNKDMKSSYYADWSGLRVSAGIVTYFKMK